MGTDNKRKADGGGSGGGGKRNKGKYFSKPNAKKDGGVPLNSRGVLVSCTVGKENVAAHDAVAMLTEAYEVLRPERAVATAAAAKAPADTSDISALIASEVADLKDASKKLFYWHSTGINSFIYVELKDADAPSPVALVMEVCRVAKESGQRKSRFVNRMYPVEHVVFANMERIDELAAKVVANHFGEDAPPTQFAVQFDHRASPHLDRMKVINLFADRIKAPHKVNLSNPDKTILVNLLKNACAVAVVERYKELAKFNIRVLTEPPEEEEGGKGAEQGGEEAAVGGAGAKAADEDGDEREAAPEGEQQGEERQQQQQQEQEEEQP